MNAPSIVRWSIASRAAASSAKGTSSKPTCFETAAASGDGPTTPTCMSRGFGECSAPTYELTNAACTRTTTSNASPSSLYPLRRGGAPASEPGSAASLPLVSSALTCPSQVECSARSRAQTLSGRRPHCARGPRRRRAWLAVTSASRLDPPPASAGGNRRSDDGGLRHRRGAGCDCFGDDGGLRYRVRRRRRRVQRVLVREACQAPSVVRASSASIEAMIAWIGIRPLAISCPPERRAAAANGAAQMFS